jgi:hypothetical protein
MGTMSGSEAGACRGDGTGGGVAILSGAGAGANLSLASGDLVAAILVVAV